MTLDEIEDLIKDYAGCGCCCGDTTMEEIKAAIIAHFKALVPEKIDPLKSSWYLEKIEGFNAAIDAVLDAFTKKA